MGTNRPLGRESGTASSLHFHLQPVPACVGEGSIYSALFLAPSSEEPDSQLMTGAHRGVSATLQNGMRTRGADVRRLKVAAFANALPSQGGGLFEGCRPPLSEHLHMAERGHLASFWYSKVSSS